MTKFFTRITAAALAVLAITATGCKKDDDTYSFTLENSSLDFEWGQTKELAYTSRNVGGFAVTETPDGWTCTHSGGVFRITAPAQDDPDNYRSGTITLTATRNDGTTLTRSVAVAVRIATEITAVANSMIVSSPGRRYKFNARRRGNETAETLTAGVKAARLWSTSRTAIVNVSLENGYVYFAAGVAEELEEANCVLAVMDKDDNVLWSWHIWATTFNPAEDPDMIGGMRVMNRNLGAFASSDATAYDAVRSYGLYYQWGRKDPFVGPRAWNSTTPVNTYAGTVVRTHAYVASDKDTGTVEYATANPNTFIAGSENNAFDWLFAESRPERWSASSKTVYDPCPAGWRVAPAAIWGDFTATGAATADAAQFNVEGDYTYGWTFVNGERPMFYPAAGRRSFSPSLANTYDNFTNVVNNAEGEGYPVGFYWSADYPEIHDSGVEGARGRHGALVFRRDYVNPATRYDGTPDYAAAGAFPLRCIAE